MGIGDWGLGLGLGWGRFEDRRRMQRGASEGASELSGVWWPAWHGRAWHGMCEGELRGRGCAWVAVARA